jgi:regulator of sirC expression with transglutaminase-like and TPR domain
MVQARKPDKEHYRELFISQLQLPEERQDLARSALYLAGEHCPSLDVEAHLAHLDRLADEAQQQPVPATDQDTLFRSLSRYLFEDAGFSGNGRDYYDADNSFLNRVLETRRGIPITLSLVYLEVGRRLGLNCYGVGLPGHFLVGLAEPDLYLDAFNGGLLLSAADCRRQVAESFGSQVPWQEEYLAPCTNREFLFRMLTNLKFLFFEDQDYRSAAAVLERLALINPSMFDCFKELAWCHLKLGERQAASGYLDRYIQGAASAGDTEVALRKVKAMWGSFARPGQQSDLP